MAPFLDKKAQDAHRRRNLFQSVALLVGIGCVLALAAAIVWGPAGVVMTALTLAALFSLAPRVPPEAVMRLYRATPVPRDDSQLSSLVDVLAYRAELKRRPSLYVIPSMTLNAFATGSPEHSAIAVTEGLLRRLTLREISGVLAHEMSHIRNNDLWVMGLADVVTRFLQLLSYVALGLAVFNVYAALSGEEIISWWAILLLYLTPALSSLLQLGLSRTREFDADLEAAALTGDPLGLASALRRLETYTGRFWEDLMFPVPTRRVPQPSLLRSHPDTKDRVDRLVSLNGRPQLEPIVIVEQPMVSLVGYGPGEMRPRYRWPGLWF
jgi:heat shock protein HtpX